MINAIFDCDPGHDDAIALMVALAHPEKINILGLTTVAGNQTLEKVTDNLLKVIDHLGFEFEVAAGFAAPLCRDPEPQPAAHGVSGMDGPLLAEAKSHVCGEHACEFMRRKIEECSGKVTIFALAPLTNIAVFLKMYPETAKKIERIALMGGSVGSGNILPKAEFNIYHDPEAADIVFKSGVPIVMSGLEVCDAGSILFSEYEPLANGGKASCLAFELLEFFSRYSRTRGGDRSPIFDMTPVIHLMQSQLFDSKMLHVDVETAGRYCRGMTVADTRRYSDAKQNVEVLADVDRVKFIDFFLDSMKMLDEKCKNKAR